MFRSHRHSFGRTHTVTWGILAAALLSTSVEAAAAPDPFVLAYGNRSGTSALSGAADAPTTRLLGRLAHGLPDPGAPQSKRCFAQALTLIAGRSLCDGAAEELAPQAGCGLADRAVTQGHRDVPHPQRSPDGCAQPDTTE